MSTFHLLEELPPSILVDYTATALFLKGGGIEGAIRAVGSGFVITLTSGEAWVTDSLRAAVTHLRKMAEEE